MTHHAMMALAGIGIATLACQWFAWWVKLPAILFLLLLGLLAGPVFGVLDPDALFGDLLFPIVSLSVAVILFEGALTLKFDQIKGLEKVVRRLVSTGVLVTWCVIAVATKLLVGLGWDLSILFGALVVVTGPTVIVPMLRTVRPNARISNILRWEGIVIDPVGALLAVLVFEFIIAFGDGHAISHTLFVFGKILAVGFVLGALIGHGFGLILRHHALPEYLHNTAALALVCGAFAVSDAIEPESGLLTVTVMGIWLANMPRVEVEEILNFKESLSVVLISALFILLAARIDVETVKQLGWAGLGVFLVIQLVARPLKVLVSTAGSDLTWPERFMLGWIAPRGIVAAAVTALFALRLQEMGYPGAELLVPLTFSVIIGTVVLQSTTSGAIARYLGVAEPEPKGYLIIGANMVARTLAEALQQQQVPVLLTSSHWGDIKAARMAGLPTFYGRAVSEHADHHLELVGMGQMLGLEPHSHMNALAALRYGPEFGRNRIYQLASKDNSKGADRDDVSREHLGHMLFGEDINYGSLASLIAKGATVGATTLSENFDLEAYEQSRPSQSTPLFSISPKGHLRPITTDSKTVTEPGWTILALNPVEASEPGA
ncbi:MAG: cation:proton antiporter [Granulosicoccaceae bacterium]